MQRIHNTLNAASAAVTRGVWPSMLRSPSEARGTDSGSSGPVALGKSSAELISSQDLDRELQHTRTEQEWLDTWSDCGTFQPAMWLRRARVRLISQLGGEAQAKKQDDSTYERAEEGRPLRHVTLSPRAAAPPPQQWTLSPNRLHLRRAQPDDPHRPHKPASLNLANSAPRPPGWRSAILALCLVVLALVSVLGLAFLHPFWASVSPIPVGGTTDSFTVLILSYGPRLPMLRGAIRHFSRCPSAAEVVVVWNKGEPPEASELASRVPVRVRAEQRNSLNNRFNVDPSIRTRAVLSIDDDIRIPCRDIEAAFAAWRAAPETMVGFFPRLLEGEPLAFHDERYAVQQGRYNVVLTGAAFLDTVTAFPAYWADPVAAARAAVDANFNGEDILMNFVLWNGTQHAQQQQRQIADGAAREVPGAPIQFFRPSVYFRDVVTYAQRRVDISKLSKVGISHDMARFHAQAKQYLRTFEDVFGLVPLRAQEFEWRKGKGRGPPAFCGVRFLGCFYY